MIKSTLTEADYIASHQLFRKPTAKTRIYDLLFCAAISAAVSYYVFSQAQAGGKAVDLPLPLPLIVFVTSFIGAVLGSYILTRLIYIWYEQRLRKLFRTDKTLQAAVELSWDAERLQSTSEYGSLLLPWKDVAFVRENDGYILLYLTAEKYFPIIKANFAPEQLQDFKTHLQNCPKK